MPIENNAGRQNAVAAHLSSCRRRRRGAQTQKHHVHQAQFGTISWRPTFFFFYFIRVLFSYSPAVLSVRISFILYISNIVYTRAFRFLPPLQVPMLRRRVTTLLTGLRLIGHKSGWQHDLSRVYIYIYAPDSLQKKDNNTYSTYILCFVLYRYIRILFINRIKCQRWSLWCWWREWVYIYIFLLLLLLFINFYNFFYIKYMKRGEHRYNPKKSIKKIVCQKKRGKFTRRSRDSSSRGASLFLFSVFVKKKIDLTPLLYINIHRRFWLLDKFHFKLNFWDCLCRIHWIYTWQEILEKIIVVTHQEEEYVRV